MGRTSSKIIANVLVFCMELIASDGAVGARLNMYTFIRMYVRIYPRTSAWFICTKLYACAYVYAVPDMSFYDPYFLIDKYVLISFSFDKDMNPDAADVPLSRFEKRVFRYLHGYATVPWTCKPRNGNAFRDALRMRTYWCVLMWCLIIVVCFDHAGMFWCDVLRFGSKTWRGESMSGHMRVHVRTDGA